MYLQEILGYGAFESGLALLPMTLTIMLLMVGATEKVVGRIGPTTALVIGLGVLGLALALFSRMPVGGSFIADVLTPSLLGAVGMSLAYIPAMITSTATVRPEDGGLASGLVNTTYQVGSAIGLAAMVAVAGSHSSGLANAGADAAAAMNGGFSAAFLGAAGIAFAAALIAAFAVRGSRPSPQAAAIAVMLVLSLVLAGCASQATSSEHQEQASTSSHRDNARTATSTKAETAPPATLEAAKADTAPAAPAPTIVPQKAHQHADSEKPKARPKATLQPSMVTPAPVESTVPASSRGCR
jgi:hypothetical protein